MDIRELRAFVTVAEELNFRKAAERLGLSQPPLTRLISQFEFELGTKLFIRSTRSVVLTGAGVHLLKKAKAILQEIHETEIEIKALSKAKKEDLIISLNAPTLHSQIPRMISVFKGQFPNFQVKILEARTQPERELLSRKVDLTFSLNEIKKSKIGNVKVQSHELGILVPLDSPLAKKKVIKFQDLSEDTLIFHSKAEKLGFQAEFLEYLKSHDIHPNVYYKKLGESCCHLVIMGRGVLVTSKKIANPSTSAIFVPFANYSPKLEIFGSWSLDNPSLPLKTFLSFLEEQKALPDTDEESHFH